MTEDLYTTADIKRVRELLYKEQYNLDACTGFDIEPKQHVLDHKHDNEMLVRGVLHRQVNAMLGKCENNFVRMLAWWYPYTLPDFLRQAADYLEQEPDGRFRHNSWLKKVKTEFNKLSASQQNLVLIGLGSEMGKNPKERKEKFSKLILDRSFGYVKIIELINSSKEK